MRTSSPLIRPQLIEERLLVILNTLPPKKKEKKMRAFNFSEFTSRIRTVY